MPIGIQGPTVALTDIRDEFALGSSDPISLSEFYGGGSYISANVATYWGIPTSGIIDISDFISTYVMANASVVIAELKTMGNTSLGGADAYSINNYLWSDSYSMADGKGNYTSAPSSIEEFITTSDDTATAYQLSTSVVGSLSYDPDDAVSAGVVNGIRTANATIIAVNSGTGAANVQITVNGSARTESHYRTLMDNRTSAASWYHAFSIAYTAMPFPDVTTIGATYTKTSDASANHQQLFVFPGVWAYNQRTETTSIGITSGLLLGGSATLSLTVAANDLVYCWTGDDSEMDYTDWAIAGTCSRIQLGGADYSAINSSAERWAWFLVTAGGTFTLGGSNVIPGDADTSWYQPKRLIALRPDYASWNWAD